MSDTQQLLEKITTLRKRLEQAQSLAREASSTAAVLIQDGPLPPQLASLARQVALADRHDSQLDHSVREAAEAEESASRMLTARARRVLERGRELLAALRPLADLADGADADPAWAGHYRETADLLETALRTVPLLPESATAQLPICAGLEVSLDVVAERLQWLKARREEHRHEESLLARLAELFEQTGRWLDEPPGEGEGRAVHAAFLATLAGEILEEAREGAPLRLPVADPAQPARFAAAHGLATARVLARVVDAHPEQRHHAAEAVLAALVHDAGMALLPAEVLTSAELADEHRRVIEVHCRDGAAVVAALFPDRPHLARAVAAHHERMDGTGYPDGLAGPQVSSLARLLAVCDTYTAMCQPRPHRPARSARTALTDTLLLAEDGKLDRQAAECLLALSFYPVGSVVELASGAVGVVVAGPRGQENPPDLSAPARPVVLVLTDAQGTPLSCPRPLDLSRCDHHSIVRALSAGERAAALGRGCLMRWQ
jgi:hypothetical protein